jgi:transcriptional regulator with GAF, ATPase, and Fis domain
MPRRACSPTPWPGNVRELGNVMERVALLAGNEGEREACKARLEKGMVLAKEVKELCLAACG